MWWNGIHNCFKNNRRKLHERSTRSIPKFSMPYKNSEKQREFQRKRLAATRAAYFKNKICVSCGSSNRLELDHINPKDKVTHSVWSWSQIKRDEELAKCQVLCHDCHLEKTKKQITKPLIHGTVAGYAKRCRCKLCREACRLARAEYRGRTGKR